MIAVPFEEISEPALRGMIEEWVSRDGTDYGSQETELLHKVAEVRAHLESGEILIAYDEETSVVSLLTREQWQSLARGVQRE